MRIEIDNKWVITSDKFQFILQEKGIAKSGKNEGEEVLKNASFHSKMDSLLRSLIMKEVRDSDVTSLREMDAKIDRVCMEISKTFTHLTAEQLSAEDA
ncbi:hypothetical protein M2403_001993 [Rahnella sp. BIGb0603]|uniref:DUF5405 family protein n=1 Tax=Rahnella sp. BIGb0603 TaxID=2940612 RepID=UPI0021696E83|nr:DUF5405 family protein [Rahnella sp. BIGb0603]MCS3423392.1 hypothetical protein [Rahnella sp. BIGb0603]